MRGEVDSRGKVSDLFEWLSRKAPKEIGVSCNVAPGILPSEVKFHSPVHRKIREILVRLTACSEEGARCSGQHVGEVSAGIAGAKNDDWMGHRGGNGWLRLSCGINLTTYWQAFHARLL